LAVYDFQKDLIKKYGAEAFITGRQLVDTKKEVLPWSPKLDIILGGGVPEGSYVNVAGPKKCGKSLSTLHFAAKCQQRGRKVFYLNIEGRIKNRDLVGINGLDIDELGIMTSFKNANEAKIFSAEEYIDYAEKIIHNIPGAVIILDSVSQLVTHKELSGDIEQENYAPGSKLMSRFLKRVSNVVPANNIIVMSILHVTSDFNRFGPGESVTGGKKIGYAADIELVCKKFAFIRGKGLEDNDKEDKKKTLEPPWGQRVTWQTGSTAIVAPGQQIDSVIRYGTGIDEVTEIMELAIQTGFIAKNGSWYNLEYLTDLGKEATKIQGSEKLYNYLKDQPEEYELLNSEVRKMLIP